MKVPVAVIVLVAIQFRILFFRLQSKDEDVQNFNITCCFVLVWNLIYYPMGENIDCVWEQVAKENIWTY
jgi:hypothetical protein